MRARRSKWLAVLGLLALGLSAGFTAQAGPVLHQYFEVDLQEDLRLGATTLDGRFPAALETESGIVPAPQPERRPDPSTTTYGGASTPNSADATYRIDRNTTRPNLVNYDDPFTPPITPFKRLYAYDAVDDGFELFVNDKNLQPLEMGGQAQDGEDQFYADLFVDLADDSPVRIPSVGPHTRVLRAQLEPPTSFRLVQDGAENWFIKADKRMRARLMLQLSVPRAVFGSPFANVSWRALAPHATALPEALEREANRVLAELGVSQLMVPGEALTRLVTHFRSFQPSEELPQARTGVALYSELTLTKKGVCRHRGYAFVITALALGLPARFVRNEAHAWVEVFDAELWHRIDLGGAASQLQSEQDTRVPPHRAPQDPFEWPEGSESALDMAAQANTSNTQGPSSGVNAPSAARGDMSRQSGPTSPGAAPQSSGPSVAKPEATSPENDEDARPRTVLDFKLGERRTRRGMPLSLTGTARAGDEACPYVRVDVVLESEKGDSIGIGSLPTDKAGRFSGSVTVPLGIDVGDYILTMSTPGTSVCGPSAGPPKSD
jgi:hypothetical protein